MAVFFLTSALMVTAVLAIRFFFKNKLSFLILYPLWGLVLLRLLLPVNIIESSISIMNLANIASSFNNKEISTTIAEQTDTSGIFFLNTKNQNLSKQEENININKTQKNNKIIIPEENKEPYSENAHEDQNLNKNNIIIKPAIIIWISGSIIFFIIIIISNAIFYKKLKTSRKHVHINNKGIPVYISDIVNTPCLTGILHPAVYLPSHIADNIMHLNPNDIQNEHLKQILAHEYTHIKHKDHIWALMRVICLGIYWFDPFVWIAASYSKQDAELACDEAVLKNCTDTEKYNYGKMLLVITQKNSYSKLYIATSLGSSKANLKERITMITKKRKVKKCHIALIAFFSIILAGCGMTNGKTTYVDNSINNKTVASLVNKTVDKTTKTKEVINPKDDERIKAFKTFMENDILSRPEWRKFKDSEKNLHWRKFKGSAKDLYFSIQYTAENIPCLFVTSKVFEISNDTLICPYALVYYYDANSKSVEFLTYMACSSSGEAVSIKDGLFITNTHHSYRAYNFTSDNNKNILVAEEVEGYYIFDDETEKQSDNFTYTKYEWKLPFDDSKIKPNIEKTPLKKYATVTTTKHYDVVKALNFEKKCSCITPIAYYKNNNKKWNKFYKDGYIQESHLYGTFSGNINKKILQSLKKIKIEDFTTAMEKSSVIIGKTRMSYYGKLSDDISVYYLNTANAANVANAILIYKGSGYYDVYRATKSKIKNLKPLDDSYGIISETGMPEFINADFDNDGEEETAFYIADQFYLIDYYYDYSYKDYNIISSSIQEIYRFNL